MRLEVCDFSNIPHIRIRCNNFVSLMYLWKSVHTEVTFMNHKSRRSRYKPAKQILRYATFWTLGLRFLLKKNLQTKRKRENYKTFIRDYNNNKCVIKVYHITDRYKTFNAISMKYEE